MRFTGCSLMRSLSTRCRVPSRHRVRPTVEGVEVRRLLSAAALAAGPGQTLYATESVVFSGAVASFTDADPGATAGDYTATIDWGDGGTSAGTIAPNSSGGFNVSGTHTYANSASGLAVGVTILDVDGTSATVDDSANVAETQIDVLGLTVSATEGKPFSGVVADCTYAHLVDVANYVATIDWGDGGTSVGTIEAAAVGFDVHGSHTYTVGGTQTIAIKISYDGWTAASGTSKAVVTDAALTAGPNAALSARALAPVTALVGSFTDAAGSVVAARFTATIAWGDGGTSAGTVAAAGGGRFTIAGTHTYLRGGSFPIGISIHDVGGATTSLAGKATVAGLVADDFDGRGTSKIAVFRPSTAQWIIAGHAQSLSFGATNLADIPVPGDYDGIGRTELAVFRPSTGQWIIKNPTNGKTRVVAFGARNLADIPVPGDYDGIGRTEEAVFTPSSGQWTILNPLTGKTRTVTFGGKGLASIPVPGDYDGIGRTEEAVFTPSAGQWTILNPLTGKSRTISFGAKNLTQIPVPGDYDGIGRTELAMFTPATAQWVIMNPLNGARRTVKFGTPNDVDLPLEAPIGSLKRLGVDVGAK